MATSKKSLASRAGSAVRRAVGGRSTADEPAEAKQTTATKAPSKAAATKAPAAKKTTAKKAPAAKKTTAKKAPAAKKATAKKAPAKAASATKKTAAKKAPAKAAPTTEKAPAAKKSAATKAPAKKAPAKKSAQKPAALVVRENETPWTAAELGEVRQHLTDDVVRLSAELEHAETGLHDLMIDSGDGSGHDQADVGSSSFERDHEISIANNARDMLTQSQHALERIEDGSYGVCEMNGEPIGKLRLMAFPRATLCMTCKQREERR